MFLQKGLANVLPARRPMRHVMAQSPWVVVWGQDWTDSCGVAEMLQNKVFKDCAGAILVSKSKAIKLSKAI
jgi:hypothetical protein